MTTPTNDARPATLRYLPGLDGLRAISVLAVIVFHHYLVGGHEQGWAPGGFLGVEVFFVVSGYLITSLLLSERRETGRVSLRDFYLRRARRLLPALFALLAVIVAYSLLFLPDAIGALRSDVLAALTYTSNWWQIIAHRSYIAQAGRPELLKHLWSLAIEEQYYLAWPFLLVYGLRRLGRQRMLTTILVRRGPVDVAPRPARARQCQRRLLRDLSRVCPDSSSAPRSPSTSRRRTSAASPAGAPGSRSTPPARSVCSSCSRRSGCCTTSASTASRSRHRASDNLAVFNGGFLLVDLATLLVIAAAVHPASDVGRALGCKPLRWIGIRSYGLYLWHYPIFCITRPGLDIHRIGIWFLSFRYAGWPVFVIRLALSFAAAEVSFRYVETPIRKGAIGRYRKIVSDAVGERRRQLVRRGVVIGGSLTLAALDARYRPRHRAAAGGERPQRQRRTDPTTAPRSIRARSPPLQTPPTTDRRTRRRSRARARRRRPPVRTARPRTCSRSATR